MKPSTFGPTFFLHGMTIVHFISGIKHDRGLRQCDDYLSVLFLFYFIQCELARIFYLLCTVCDFKSVNYLPRVLMFVFNIVKHHQNNVETPSKNAKKISSDTKLHHVNNDIHG